MYTKPLKTIKVTTRQTEITASDTLTESIASDALYEYEKRGTMELPTLVPFHAIETLETSITTAEAEKGDPYGCADPNGLTTEDGTEITDENDNPIISG